jgi:hypothetical protein
MPKLLLILFFEESRSVAFGLWLYISATWLLMEGKIDGQVWQFIAGGSTLLVGGRAVVAEYFGKGKKDAPPSQPQ